MSTREFKDEKPLKIDRLTILGLVITAIWTVGFIVSITWTYNETITMRPNEWGDLLAGYAAPIAFVWIVIGYFQQREELSLNTRALILQQGELQNQVEETRRLVAESAKQAALSEEANMLSARNLIPLVLREQPEFEVDLVSYGYPECVDLRFRNTGKIANEVRFQCDSAPGRYFMIDFYSGDQRFRKFDSKAKLGEWSASESKTIRVARQDRENIQKDIRAWLPANVQINYVDTFGVEHWVRFKIIIEGQNDSSADIVCIRQMSDIDALRKTN